MRSESFLHGGAFPALQESTIDDVLLYAAKNFANDNAITSVWQGKRCSFSELSVLVSQIADALLAAGISGGDRVGVWGSNRIEWIAVQFAVARIGAILVPINPAFRQDELEYAIAHSGSKALFLASKFRNFDCMAAAVQVQQAHPQLKLLVRFDDDAGIGPAVAWSDFLASGVWTGNVTAINARASISHHDAAAILYTSGTTGKPKGATLSHFNLVNNGFHVGLRLQLGVSDRICLPVPLFHCFGMVIGVLGAFSHGASLVLPGQGFDVDECFDAIEHEACTGFYGVPMMFISMLNHANFDTSRLLTLRAGLMGGAPCPSETFAQAVQKMHLPDLSVVYGMTETSPISLQTSLDDPVEMRSITVGRPHPHVEIKIADVESGEAMPIGEAGEFCVRGYLNMLAYWNDPVATSATIDRDGWLHSGDLAIQRPDGMIEIVGRIKDMIIRGGENIFPREVEEMLCRAVPDITEAYVFGIPDSLYGEQVCAWVRLKDGVSMCPEEIQDKCKGLLATFKIPRYIRTVDMFPSSYANTQVPYMTC